MLVFRKILRTYLMDDPLEPLNSSKDLLRIVFVCRRSHVKIRLKYIKLLNERIHHKLFECKIDYRTCKIFGKKVYQSQ